MVIQKELAKHYPNAFFRMVIDLGEEIVFSRTWSDWQIITFLQLYGWSITIEPDGYACSLKIGAKEYMSMGKCDGAFVAYSLFDDCFAKIEEIIVGKAVLRNQPEPPQIGNKK